MMDQNGTGLGVLGPTEYTSVMIHLCKDVLVKSTEVERGSTRHFVFLTQAKNCWYQIWVCFIGRGLRNFRGI